MSDKVFVKAYLEDFSALVKPNDQIVEKIINAKDTLIRTKKDNAKMVLIPAGSFEMGDHLDNMLNALPVHTVELDAFYMDMYEVTVGQFKKFVQESKYSYNQWNDVAIFSPTNDHPMSYVNWYDATAYAKWVDKRLPTEAEWEYAARGGLKHKNYPWGDEFKPNGQWPHNIWQGEFPVKDTGDDGFSGTAPVASFPPNDYDLYDMTGNAWEWCQDKYRHDYYATRLRREN